MKTKQNLELKIGQVKFDYARLFIEGEDKNRLWDYHKKSYEYATDNKNHRFVLHKDSPESISFYLANNCENSEEVADKFSLDIQNLIAGGRLYPSRPSSLKNLVLIPDCYQFGSFIPTNIARDYAALLKEDMNQQNKENLNQQQFNITKIRINSKSFESVNEFWIENEFLPSSIRAKKLTIEKAGKKIEEILDKAEMDFMSEYERLPSLYLESDYEKFAEFLNIPKQIRKFRHLEKPDREDRTHYISSSIAGHDIAYALIKRFLQREKFFKDKRIIDAIFGTVDYRAPKREFEMRIKSLNELIDENIVISNDEWDRVTNSLHVIKKKCFLPKASKQLMEKNHNNLKLERAGYKNIGTHMVNPVSGMFSDIEFATSLKEIVQRYNEQGYLGKMAYYR